MEEGGSMGITGVTPSVSGLSESYLTKLDDIELQNAGTLITGSLSKAFNNTAQDMGALTSTIVGGAINTQIAAKSSSLNLTGAAASAAGDQSAAGTTSANPAGIGENVDVTA